MDPISDGDRQQLGSIFDQWQRELSKPAYDVMTEALGRQFAAGLVASLAESAGRQRLAARMSKPVHGAIAAALARQFASGRGPKIATTEGRDPVTARLNAVSTDATRPQTLRFAERLLASPGHQSLVRMQRFELGAEALARVEMAAAVSLVTDILGDPAAVKAIEHAAAGLDEGPLADVAESRDWPILTLLLAILYNGVLATIVAVEVPEAGPGVGHATDSLALAILVVRAYADRQP